LRVLCAAVAGAAGEVVVHQAAGLHERVEGGRAHEAKAAAAELPGDGHGLRSRLEPLRHVEQV